MTAGGWEGRPLKLLNEEQRKSNHRGEVKPIFKKEAGSQNIKFHTEFKSVA